MLFSKIDRIIHFTLGSRNVHGQLLVVVGNIPELLMYFLLEQQLFLLLIIKLHSITSIRVRVVAKRGAHVFWQDAVTQCFSDNRKQMCLTKHASKTLVDIP